LIVLLRDPAERAYSHYKERVRHDAEPLSFARALDAEPDRLRGEAERIRREPGYRSVEHEDHSYLAQGRYLDLLPRWFELFAREQFYLAASEDFYADPGRIVGEVWSFLGLPPATLRSQKRFNYHPAPDIDAATRERLHAAFAEHNRDLEEFLGRSLPWAGRGQESVGQEAAPESQPGAGQVGAEAAR
jgi:Sulfotransferase domain